MQISHLKGMYYRSVRGPNLPPPASWPLPAWLESTWLQNSHTQGNNLGKKKKRNYAYLRYLLIWFVKSCDLSVICSHWYNISELWDYALIQNCCYLKCDVLCPAPVSSQGPLSGPLHTPTRAVCWPPHHHHCHTASQLFALVYTVINPYLGAY